MTDISWLAFQKFAKNYMISTLDFYCYREYAQMNTYMKKTRSDGQTTESVGKYHLLGRVFEFLCDIIKVVPIIEKKLLNNLCIGLFLKQVLT